MQRASHQGPRPRSRAAKTQSAPTANFPASGRAASRSTRLRPRPPPARSKAGNRGRTPKHRRSDEDRLRFRMAGSHFRAVRRDAEPRGESSLVVRRFLAITFAARAVSHAFDSRGLKGLALDSAALKAARTILTGFVRVKKRALRCKYPISRTKRKIFRPVGAPACALRNDCQLRTRARVQAEARG